MNSNYPEDGERRLIRNVATYLLHYVTSLKAAIVIIVAVRTANLTS
jgi:hypothetical protein